MMSLHGTTTSTGMQGMLKPTPKKFMVNKVMKLIPSAYNKESTVYIDVKAGLEKLSMHELRQLHVMLLSRVPHE